MVQRFPFVLRTGKKILEIAGAGCASAVVAFLLGGPHEQPSSAATLANTPAVVRLAPTDEEMIRAVRHDSAALVAHLRGGAQQTAGTTAATSATSSAGVVVSTSASSKSPKTTPPQTRREAKVGRPPVAETKPHTPEPSPVAVAAAPAPVPQATRPQAPATVETTEPRLAQASTVPADSGQLLGIKPISTWFSEVPRPPVGIGESPARAM